MRKNLRIIPKAILSKVGGMETDMVAIGCSKKFRMGDELKAFLSRIGLQREIEEFEIGDEFHILPPANKGKYCRRNRNGVTYRLLGRPKRTVKKLVFAPVWGRGRKWMWRNYWCCPKRHEEPALQEIEIRVVCRESDSITLTFRLTRLLNKKSSNFSKDLLCGLNVLNESVGDFNVYEDTTPVEEYQKIVRVKWQILPPDSSKERILGFLQQKKLNLEKEVLEKKVAEKLEFMSTFKDQELIVGTDGFCRYIGVRFSSDLVLFDCIDYGNACYIFHKEWELLSKMSRIQLLSGLVDEDFHRVVHGKNWQQKVFRIIEAYLDAEH